MFGFEVVVFRFSAQSVFAGIGLFALCIFFSAGFFFFFNQGGVCSLFFEVLAVGFIQTLSFGAFWMLSFIFLEALIVLAVFSCFGSGRKARSSHTGLK